MSYSEKEIYENKIHDCVRKILVVCAEHKIPVFMTFAVADDGEKTIYKNEMLSAKALDQDLSNDQIAKHALVTDGFDVVPEVKDPVYIEDEK